MGPRPDGRRRSARPARRVVTAVVTTVVIPVVTALLLGACSGGSGAASPTTATSRSVTSRTATSGGGATASPATTTGLGGTLTRVDAVLPGMCFNALPDKQQALVAVLVIGCEDAHTFEAFATFTSRLASKKVATTTTPTSSAASQDRSSTTTSTTTGASKTSAYPGDLAVRDDAEAQCVGAFTEWMGIDWTSSSYDIQSWWPSESSWPRGDRAILCAAYRVTGGATKGSVRGTKQ